MKNEELKKGDYFTVKGWVSHFDNSFKGDLLQAIVIDLPFVRVKRYLPKSASKYLKRKFTLNLDQVNIKSLSAEFADDVLAEIYSDEIEKVSEQIGVAIKEVED